MTVRTILDQFTTVIEAMTVNGVNCGLRRASYRRRLDQMEPNGGSHRRFAIDAPASRVSRNVVGSSQLPIAFDVNVRVFYFRGGGDAGGGDRKSINAQAGIDMTRIADALGDIRNWNRQVTAIRDVRFQASSMVSTRALSEVWESRFMTEAMYTWPA